MKRIYIWAGRICLMCFWLSGIYKSQAQYVTIPDTAFVGWMNRNGFAACMNGNQMDTTCPAIINARGLYCYAIPVKDLTGVQYFKNIDTLDCSNDSLYFIPAFPKLSLKYINCQYNNLDSLPALPAPLTYLNCNSNRIEAFPPLPDNLLYLSFANNAVDTLLSLPPGLQSMMSNSNYLTALPSLPASLFSLDCGYNKIAHLPALPGGLLHLVCDGNLLTGLPALPNLNSLSCSFNQITGISVLPASLSSFECSSNLIHGLPSLPPALQGLSCNNNLLTSLPVLPAGLNNLFCGANQLTWLPALPPKLYWLSCDSNQLTSIPQLPDSMSLLYCTGNPNLTCLPQLKVIGEFNFDGTAVSCLPNYGTVNFSIPALNTIPLCGVFNPNACTPYWNVSGQVFYDANNNCRFDSVDAGQGNIKVQLYSNGNLVQQTYTGGTGNYSFQVPDGNYVIVADTLIAPFSPVCPQSGALADTVSVTDTLSYNNNFAFVCRSPGFDVGTQSIVNGGEVPRPAGIFTMYTVAGDISALYGAHCAAGISGEVQMHFTGPVTFVSPAYGALTPNSVQNNTATWNIPDFGNVHDLTDFNTIFQVDTHAVAGTLVCFEITVTPLAGDYNPLNNKVRYCFEVVDALDPNEKEVYPTTIDSAGEWLTYTVRFQNTGSAPAVNIVVTDTLNSNLDVSTFQLLTSSHKNLTQVIGNIAKFSFANINLADSLTSDSLSRGYVQYRIKTNSNLSLLGETVTNTAYIYFDLNPPVATNTVSTPVADTVSHCLATYDSLTASICAGDTFKVGNIAHMQAGSFTDTLTNVTGCDSIVSLALAVNDLPVVTFTWDSLAFANGPLIYLFTGNPLDTIGVWCLIMHPVRVPLLLKGGNLPGGIYSGNYVRNNILYVDSNSFPLNVFDTITYSYTDLNGCSANAAGYFLLTACEGINEISLNNSISLYPNPAADQLFIKTENIQPQSIIIYDVNGRMISTMPFKPEVNVNELSSGVYFVEVQSNEGLARKRFVKM